MAAILFVVELRRLDVAGTSAQNYSSTVRCPGLLRWDVAEVSSTNRRADKKRADQEARKLAETTAKKEREAGDTNRFSKAGRGPGATIRTPRNSSETGLATVAERSAIASQPRPHPEDDGGVNRPTGNPNGR